MLAGASLLLLTVVMPSSALGAQRVITSPGPLTNIYLNDTLACQVNHTGDLHGEFFGGSDPGACGTFIHTGGTVYGPTVPAGIGRMPYDLVSQTGVTGSGTSANPYRVVTVVDVGTTGLRITQSDFYVVGDEFYRSDIEVSNSSESAVSAALYHAGDCYLQESDSGYGFHDTSGGGIYCSANPDNSPSGRILGFVPLSSGSSYLESSYSAVWSAINGTQFPNTCACAIFQDNGAGVSWNINVPSSGSVTRSLFSAFSPTGEPPPPDDPPTYGDDVNIAPVGGTVRFKPPGASQSQPLTGAQQIPVGTIINATEGRIRLTAARGPGGDRTQTADFYSGLFKILQPNENPPVTELRLLGFRQSDCTGASTQASAERRRRGLWGRGRGRFRTRGRHGSASVRGTAWFTQDRCDGTYFEVEEGSVDVRDFTRDRALVLRAGQNYLAPAITSVEAGDGFTCGVQYRGPIACRGDDAFGQATPPPGTFSAVSAGGAHACGLRANDKVDCWGRNGSGQADPLGGTFSAVSAGGNHTCGIRTNGGLACWGRNGSGQADPPGGAFSAVSAGSFHTCGLKTNGTLACWGNDAFGQASPPGGKFSTVSAGGLHSCGIRANGAVTCWGRNTFGQADPLGGSFSAVSAGGSHSCGIRANGTLACWGRNGSGQADPPGGAFSAVSAGGTHSCGLRTSGDVDCWGSEG
jgi:hypothetical protein